jgi:hypothetical protein
MSDDYDPDNRGYGLDELLRERVSQKSGDENNRNLPGGTYWQKRENY